MCTDSAQSSTNSVQPNESLPYLQYEALCHLRYIQGLVKLLQVPADRVIPGHNVIVQCFCQGSIYIKKKLKSEREKENVRHD